MFNSKQFHNQNSLYSNKFLFKQYFPYLIPECSVACPCKFFKPVSNVRVKPATPIGKITQIQGYSAFMIN